MPKHHAPYPTKPQTILQFVFFFHLLFSHTRFPPLRFPCVRSLLRAGGPPRAHPARPLKPPPAPPCRRRRRRPPTRLPPLTPPPPPPRALPPLQRLRPDPPDQPKHTYMMLALRTRVTNTQWAAPPPRVTQARHRREDGHRDHLFVSRCAFFSSPLAPPPRPNVIKYRLRAR